MSTSSKPKGRQAHQNRVAFRHNKNSPLTRKIAETVTTHGLCARCTEKIHWRKQYRKYKPLTAPRKCNTCHQKTVKAAYHTLCHPCARQQRVCAGCAKAAEVQEDMSPKEISAEESIVNHVVKGLPERQKRTVERRIARGESPLDVVEEFVDISAVEGAQKDKLSEGDEAE